MLRLSAVIVLAYWLGCLLMVAATPRPQRFDCHGQTRSDCFDELISRRARDLNKPKPWWRAELVPPASAGPATGIQPVLDD